MGVYSKCNLLFSTSQRHVVSLFQSLYRAFPAAPSGAWHYKHTIASTINTVMRQVGLAYRDVYAALAIRGRILRYCTAVVG